MWHIWILTNLILCSQIDIVRKIYMYFCAILWTVIQLTYTWMLVGHGIRQRQLGQYSPINWACIVVIYNGACLPWVDLIDRSICSSATVIKKHYTQHCYLNIVSPRLSFLNGINMFIHISYLMGWCFGSYLLHFMCHIIWWYIYVVLISIALWLDNINFALQKFQSSSATVDYLSHPADA
jgi:hypothetical protein